MHWVQSNFKSLLKKFKGVFFMGGVLLVLSPLNAQISNDFDANSVYFSRVNCFSDHCQYFFITPEGENDGVIEIPFTNVVANAVEIIDAHVFDPSAGSANPNLPFSIFSTISLFADNYNSSLIHDFDFAYSAGSTNGIFTIQFNPGELGRSIVYATLTNSVGSDFTFAFILDVRGPLDFQWVKDSNDNLRLTETSQGENLIFIAPNGQVGINTENVTSDDPEEDFYLSVAGHMRATEVQVEEVNNWSDFVFEEGYQLKTLEEVDQYIKKHGKLPDIPSEANVKANGYNMGEMDAKLLQKLEELTLYLIEQEREIKALEEAIENQSTNSGK